jgi:hypothetical protein
MDQAIQLTYQFMAKVKDYCDNPQTPQVGQIMNQLHDLLGEEKRHANRDTLFFRARKLQDQIEEIRSSNTVYSPQHWNDLFQRSVQLQQLFRSLP